MITKEESTMENKMITKDDKIESIDTEINEISKRILLELESVSSKDLSDVHYVKMILNLSDIHYTKRVLQDIGKLTCEAQGEIEKRAVIKVLLFSTWLQRLYFINKILPHGTDKFGSHLPLDIVSWHDRRYYGSYLWHIRVCIFVSYNKTI